MKFIAAFFACLIGVAAAHAQGLSAGQYPILADDGGRIANFDLTPQMQATIKSLKGQVPVGNLNGDVTLLQFYDLNCPYCREAAADIDAIVRTDQSLRLVFVPYAVLSIQSVQGALIELGAAPMLSPAQNLDFHHKLYASRGTIDGPRALAAAKDVGLDPQKVAAAGNTEATLDLLRTTAKVGGDAGLAATPAYVIGGVAIVGHPGRKSLEKVIASMRQCKKVVC
jgi:protein-disulfide isomerase